ncbi:Flagellar assembly factor FliW [bacterium HR21]|nr:Flagellar assembly factor FliW [bacterium HR21]
MPKQKQTLIIPRLGTVRLSRRDIFHFPAGLIGFEQLKDYILVGSPDMEPLRWLIAVEDPTVGLPVLLPWYVLPHYELPAAYTDVTTYVPLVVVTLAAQATQITVNLKAPIVLNIRSRQGQQLILPGDRYSATHPLMLSADVASL